MFYIHHTTCISPQQTFPNVDIAVLHPPIDGQLRVIEPPYTGIPSGVLRRMSRSVRMGVGAALPLLNGVAAPDGIIIGTANAGMEECFDFLKQIVEYNEGLLTPGNFVQSTPNAIAAQLGMLSGNKGYNITHVHLGLAFENAVTDASMLIQQYPENSYLLGAVDDISSYNYTLNLLAGWYKNAHTKAQNFYDTNSPGSIAGEGVAMFMVNGNAANALAQVKAFCSSHTTEANAVEEQLKNFLNKNLAEGEKIDVLLSGENGDNRLSKFYTACEELIPEEALVLRFKHLCGEYPTASAVALWLACYVLQNKPLPAHIIKKNFTVGQFKNLLIYNCYKGVQHSFMLVKA
ncbi:MAG: beta-ketoacyl synthase chain length factor [Ferruginibacter sp.]